MTIDSVRPIIELIAAAGMIGLPALVIFHRIFGRQRGYSPKTVQLCVILSLVPFFLLAGLMEAIDKTTLGTLIGSLMGYALGSSENTSSGDDSRRDNPDTTTKTN